MKVLYQNSATRSCTSRPDQSNLNASTGLARKCFALALGINTLLAGCGDPQAIRNEIASLPHVTPTEVVNRRSEYVGKKVAIEGKVVLERNESSQSIIPGFIPVIVDDVIITVPNDIQVDDTRLWYSISADKAEAGSIWVFSDTVLHPNTVVISGKVEQAANGQVYIRNQGSLYVDHDGR